jgi:hypothetical protein
VYNFAAQSPSGCAVIYGKIPCGIAQTPLGDQKTGQTRKRDITDFGKLDKDNQIFPVFNLFSGTVRAGARRFGRPCFRVGKQWLQSARRSRVTAL